MLITVDPGVHACGCAWFSEGVLVRAELRTEPIGLSGPSFVCVCEKPQVYEDLQKYTTASGEVRWRKIRTEDLIDLAIAAGRMTGQLSTRYVLPRTWKGQVPKTVHGRRIIAALTDEERNVLDLCGAKKGLLHNVVDAIGLGLWSLGRLK